MNPHFHIKALGLLCLSIISFNLSFGQTTDGSSQLAFKRITFTTTATDYIPSFLMNTANYNIGAEVYLKNRKSIAVNFGLIKSYGETEGGLFEIATIQTRGIKVEAEVRHYLNKHKLFEPSILVFWPHIFQYKSQKLQNTGYYLSLHSSFQSTITDRKETVHQNIVPLTYYNAYSVERDRYSLNLKIGYKCIKSSNLTIDYCIGLGIQYVSSSSKNRVNSDINWSYVHDDIGKKPFDTGSIFYLNALYQVKLGWSF